MTNSKYAKLIRSRLTKYHVSSDESMLDAVDRLIKEHAEAVECAGVHKRLAEDARKEASIARATRDAAQNSANAALARARVEEANKHAMSKALFLLLPLLPEPEQDAIKTVIDQPRVERNRLAVEQVRSIEQIRSPTE